MKYLCINRNVIDFSSQWISFLVQVNNGVCNAELRFPKMMVRLFHLFHKNIVHSKKKTKPESCLKHGIRWTWPPLKEKRFSTIEDIKEKSKQDLLPKRKSVFQKCLEDCKKRWHMFIVSDGGCLEGAKYLLINK